MTGTPEPRPATAPHPAASVAMALGQLLDLSRQARQAQTAAEVEFLLVNESLALAPYRQAALWGASYGVLRLSGVLNAEVNAPYAQWIDQVCRHVVSLPAVAEGGSEGTGRGARLLTSQDLPAPLAEAWPDWWPAHALWISTDPTRTHDLLPGDACLVLARDEPWTQDDIRLLSEWVAVGWHARRLLTRPAFQWLRAGRAWWTSASAPGRPWWKQPKPLTALLVGLLLVLPVRQTVMAPGELVPLDPAVIRAPIEGVIDRFLIKANQEVKAGQPLFSFDEVVFKGRQEVAEQALMTAEIEYRQTAQQALSDPKFKMQLAVLMSRIEEKRAELDYLREQSVKLRVLAPRDGVALLDDPSQWVGRTVNVGERVMRVAEIRQSEIEAWVGVGDAIALKPDAAVSLFLSASPLSPVSARVRYMAFEAEQRPDGTNAYRLRAQLTEPTDHRVGAKGTAKIYGGWVPLGYWLVRRPLAVLRSTLGM